MHRATSLMTGLFSSWILLLLLTSSCQSSDPETLKRPNILFILTDDQRYDDLAVTGNPIVRTPHIDRLATEGVRFENAYVTSAICTPSRASIFLSLYERRHGINFNSGTALAPEAWRRSYPVLLHEAGYFTGYVGKNHVPVGEKGYFDSLMARSFDFWYAGHGHLTFYPKERHKIFNDARNDTQVEVLYEGAIDFLNAAPREQPFCLSVAFNLPHGAGVRSMEMRPDDPELYRSAYRDQLIDISDLYVAKNGIKAPKLPPEVLHAQYRQATYDYVNARDTLTEITTRRYQTITGIDRFVGRLREILYEKGISENTIIVFCSDHGIMEGEFGLGGKALNYEACLKVPLIVYDPRLPKDRQGKVYSQLVQTLDIAPSFLQWAGMAIPETMQGLPLQPLLSGDTSHWRLAVFGENLWSTVFGNPRIESVRRGKWKYIRYFQNDLGGPEERSNPYGVSPEDAEQYRHFLTASIEGEQPVYEELYNLDEDPKETTNLAERPVHAERMEALRKLCQQKVTEAYGEGPKVVPYTSEVIQNLK